MELFDVIKYEGDNDTVIWKYEKEDFNIGSQLIVHESQEAIFFLNGQALEVYFVNMVEHLAIKWGTDSKIQYMEPSYNFPIYIGANGEMSISMNNSKKLLVKLVGTEKNLSKERLVSYFKSFLMIRLKPYLSKYIRENKINIFEIDEKLETISNDVKDSLISDFEEYGISLKQFFITSIVKPDGDEQYERFKDLHFRQYADIAEAELQQKVGIINQETESKKTVIEAKGIAEKRKTEGYTYQEERGYDVAEKMAENEGAGNFSSAGIGMGIMASVGNTMNNTFGNAMNNVNANTENYCDNCGAKLEPNQKFCDNCGKEVNKEEICPYCSYKFKKASKYCPNCGKERKQ